MCGKKFFDLHFGFKNFFLSKPKRRKSKKFYLSKKVYKKFFCRTKKAYNLNYALLKLVTRNNLINFHYFAVINN